MAAVTKAARSIAFSLHPRVFAALGSDLVTSDAVALIELVKNAYDALATQVDVRFIGEEGVQPTAIEVTDNGTGMTLNELARFWAVVATPHRLNKPMSGRRRVSGEKGLGRLSTARLGSSLQLLTRSKGAPCLQVDVNWNLLAKQKNIASCRFAVQEIEPCPFEGTGTLVRISKLRSRWGSEEYEDLEDHLSRLVSPFQQVKDFAISFTRPGKQVRANEVEPPPFLGSPPYLLQGQVTSSGELHARYSFSSGKSRTKSIKSNLRAPEKVGKKTKCGPFSFEIRAWDVDFDSLERLATAKSVTKETIRKAIRNYKGLSVYRDRILVLPKSEAARDWLGLDLRRVSKVGTRLSTSQIVGYVAISSAANQQLSDTSDRERLVDNPASAEFKQLLKRVVEALEVERDVDRQDTSHREPPLKDLFQNLSASRLVRDVRQLVTDNAPVQDAVPLIEEFDASLQKTVADIERRFYYYSRVASLGLLAATIVHEVRNKCIVIESFLALARQCFASDLGSNSQAKRAIELAEKALDSLERLADTFAPLASRAARKRRTSNLGEVLQDCIAMREPDVRSREVQIDCSPAQLTHTVNVDPGELSAVLINFLDNALYWVSYAPEHKRRILFEVKASVNSRIEVQVHDSGPGITKGDEERIFWPGVTRKPDGLGMGLTVASEIVSQHGGETKLMVPGKLGGASFVFDLPVAR
jgi:C4-dicarboxylate-specific signal transduction histidine kinase